MADDQPSLRCADTDRERVAGMLREHYAEGRLDLNEYQERTSTVYAAKTFGDLDRVTSDLPAAAVPSPARTEPDVTVDVGITRRLLPVVALAAAAVGIWLVSSLAVGSFNYFWVAWILGFTSIALARRGSGGCGEKADHGCR